MSILVEPSAALLLEKSSTESQQRAVERLAALQPKPMVLDATEMKRLLLPEMKLVKAPERPTEFSLNDLAAAWASRFNILQQLLLRRPETAGAASIAAASGKCTVIGQVKKLKNVELEDPTGSMELICDKKLLPDDVIAVRGFAANGVMQAEDIFFPDIHLNAVRQLEGTLGVGTEADFMIRPVATEFWEINGTTILVHKADWKALADALMIQEVQVPVELLRRRHLAAPPWDVMEPQPDIFIAAGMPGVNANYKGTAIIGIGEKSIIDLAKREAC